MNEIYIVQKQIIFLLLIASITKSFSINRSTVSNTRQRDIASFLDDFLKKP